MSKSKTIKTHLSKKYRDKLQEIASNEGVSVTDYLTKLIIDNMYSIPPHKKPYLINQHTVLGIRIDEEIFCQLQAKVNFENMNISEYLRELIYTDIRNHN